MISSFRRPGTTEYNLSKGARTLECNWQEERSRIEAGERVHLPLMAGATVRPFEPDISIPPATRDPDKPTNGQLLMPERKRNSRTTNDSSRQGADDGFREYKSMSQTFFPTIEERVVCPVSSEAYFHGTWGGPVQLDGRSKTRVGPANRAKNEQHEAARMADGEMSATTKMIGVETFEHAFVARPSSGTTQPSGFGSVVPHHPPSHSERVLESTAMASWR